MRIKWISECFYKVLNSDWHTVDSLEGVAIKNLIKTTVASPLSVDATVFLCSPFYSKWIIWILKAFYFTEDLYMQILLQ